MASGGLNNEELWRECANWLTRCDVLRSDHRANLPSASIVDFATILRDGVLLCNLLNILDPGCIDFKDVNQKPQMAQFLCLRNIETFLNTCKDIFGIRDAELFEPLMLFDLTDFHRVLCTLAKLSNSSKALRRVSPGFSAHKNDSREDIYQSLQSIDAPMRHTQWTDDQDHTEYATYYCHITSEQIYQDLCSVRQTSATPPVEKRDHVIKELLDTEKNYVEVLNKLKMNFMRPLSYILRAECISVIFKEIPELYDIHSGFFSKLREFYKDGKPDLSSVFLNWREKFLIYGSYCANLTDAQAMLQDICDNNEIANQEIIKCQMEANNGKFKLRDVLSVPMQRILKYHLLLQKLIEETSHNHEEYKSLKRAREAMVDVASYINEVKRDSDHLVLLRKLQENISEWNIPGDYPIQYYGRLLKDGDMRIKSHDDQKIRSRYVFIFDKIMVLCKQPRSNQFSFKEVLMLHEYYLEDIISRAILSRETRWSYQWLLAKKNKSTVYTLYVRTAEIKKKMMKAMQEALDNIEPSTQRNTSHKFEMHTFEKPVCCNRCSKFLKGLIYQGYECKVCHIAVHKECIAQSGRCTLPAPAPPLISSTHLHHSHSHHHMDELIKDKLWFAGEMERDAATCVLENRIVGTYLLRVRPQGGDARYALSLKTYDTVRHMRVFKKRIEDTEQYFLSESRFFKSVLDLVRYYEHASLRENYERLEENAKLQWPYRQLLAIVECDFSPLENNQLRLTQGYQVIVYNTDDYGELWKGKCQNQVGLFPKHCVRVLKELTQDIE